MKLLAAVCLVGTCCLAAPFALLGAPNLSLPGIVGVSPARQGALVRGHAPPGTRRVTLSVAGAEPIEVTLGPDSMFLLGFDRDAAGEARITATLTDGRIIEKKLVVAAAAWPIERVDVPLRPRIPSADFIRVRAKEQEQIAAARVPDPARAAPDGWHEALRWPIDGRVTGRFGAQRIYRGQPGSYHGGTDIAAPTGAPVRAPGDGVVTLAPSTPFTLEGKLVLIDHGGGLESALMHLSRVDVRAGQRVMQGQMIGAVGQTGRATGPHLHWGLRWHAARLDPAAAAQQDISSAIGR